MRLSGVALLGLLAWISQGAFAAESRWDQEALDKSLRQQVIAGTPIAKIERLIQLGADFNARAPYGETALEYAIRFGRYRAALRLIELGADPNSENDSGMTPLHWAVSDANGSHVVEALLLAGADVNRRDFYGRTALMLAAQADSVRSVAVILARAGEMVEIDAQSDHLESASSLARDGMVPRMLEIARKRQRGETDLELGATVTRF
ncbi:MAG: ankyrin repeat domain-containing protein [Oligoflexia bacterium]|nr:ankyrin repeat domain-containing protein [Oligoflexia bacterium]